MDIRKILDIVTEAEKPLASGMKVMTPAEFLQSQGVEPKSSEEDVAEGLNEMDKSAPQPGRDGKISHSTYGSRDKEGDDYFKGKEVPVKPITVKKMEKDALAILKKQGVTEDWQKVNRQDKTDGLSPAAVKAYRRENPGSKLQTAVTEKNPSGKRAKRRLSFCRRMKGMKEKLTSAKTSRDPDSRINKALRRWNCN